MKPRSNGCGKSRRSSCRDRRPSRPDRGMSMNVGVAVRGKKNEEKKGRPAQGSEYTWISVASVATGLAIWHVISLITNPLFLVGPWETVVEIGELVTSGEYLDRKSTRLNSSH